MILSVLGLVVAIFLLVGSILVFFFPRKRWGAFGAVLLGLASLILGFFSEEKLPAMIFFGMGVGFLLMGLALWLGVGAQE